MQNLHPVFENIFKTSFPVLYETLPVAEPKFENLELAYAEGELMLLPATTNMACENCGGRQTLTELRHTDADGESYYNVLCGLCRAEEAGL